MTLSRLIRAAKAGEDSADAVNSYGGSRRFLYYTGSLLPGENTEYLEKCCCLRQIGRELTGSKADSLAPNDEELGCPLRSLRLCARLKDPLVRPRKIWTWVGLGLFCEPDAVGCTAGW